MRLLSITLVLGFIIGCNQQPTPISNYLRQIHHCQNPSQYKILVFLPQNSCQSCLSKIVSFLNNQQNISNHIGIVIAGYNHPDIIALKSSLIKRENAYLTDIKYQYLQYSLFDASTAFWAEQNKDGTLQTYALDTPRLAVNLLLLQKVMSQPL